MKTTRLFLPVALLFALAGCGNKGPLVHPTAPADELPAPTTTTTPDATLPTPASTAPATPTDAIPAADATTPPPPPPGGD